MQYSVLPPALLEALGGVRLEQRLGEGMVVMVNGAEGVPRSAALSLGEVLAPSDRELHLCLHLGSRTRRELDRAGAGISLLAHEGVLYKVEVNYQHAFDEDVDGVPLSFFRGRVERVETDAVHYAGSISVLGHQIFDAKDVLRRWNLQMECLRRL